MHAEQAWTNYYALRTPLTRRAMQVVAELEPVTGLAPHPGAHKLVETLIDLCLDEHVAIDEMDMQRSRALAAEEASRPPPPPPPPPPTFLDQLAAADGIGSWIKTASPADVIDALADERTDEERSLWAQELLACVRGVGGTHEIIATLNAAVATPVEAAKMDPEPAKET